MTARPDTAAVAEGAVGTKPQRGEVNQEKGQNQMTRENTVNVPHPLDGAFITTESMGNADPAKRTGVFKVAFSGEGCIERLHAAEDYLKGLVEADRAAPLHEGEGEDWSELERLATEATPGPWRRSESHLSSIGWTIRGPDREAHTASGSTIILRSDIATVKASPKREANAAFIAAANPATILKLIASARSAHEGEGEPVAWRGEADGIDECTVRPDTRDDWIRYGRKITPLFAAPPPSVEVERLREALEKIAADGEPYRSGYCQTDISVDPALTAQEAQDVARAALSPGVPTTGAWVEWSGGPNPAGHHDVVEAKRLDGSIVTKAAFKFDWRRGPIAHGSDIIAYRIVPTPGGEG